MLFFVGINYWAVLVCGVLSMILGAIWYNPKVVGGAWMRSMGWTPEHHEKLMKQFNPGASYGLMFLGSLVMALVMSQLVVWMSITTAAMGAGLGAILWLGSIATCQLGVKLFEQRPWAYFLTTTGYYLIQLALFGAILASWR